jgi:superfamily II DNA/RNA helicase
MFLRELLGKISQRYILNYVFISVQNTQLIFRLIPKSAQIVFFSATFPDHVRAFATTVAPQANMISLKQEEVSVDSIKQFYMDCKNAEHKATTLCDIYGLMTIGQSIIFVRVMRYIELVGETNG